MVTYNYYHCQTLICAAQSLIYKLSKLYLYVYTHIKTTTRHKLTRLCSYSDTWFVADFPYIRFHDCHVRPDVRSRVRWPHEPRRHRGHGGNAGDQSVTCITLYHRTVHGRCRRFFYIERVRMFWNVYFKLT